MKNQVSKADYDRFFQTDHLKVNLKQRSVRGGFITIVAQGLKFGLNLSSNILLARLLTPADYGLVGMVTAITGFVALFKDLGLSMATVQRDEINHRQVSTLFWINIGLSVVATGIALAIAPVLSWFYHEPRLVWITVALSSGFLISGLGVQHSALLNRQMQYSVLVVNDVLAQFIGIVVAIVAAYYGSGYWALIIFPLVSALVSTVGFWIACRWRPGRPIWRSDVLSMLTFGSNLTAFSTVNYFSRNLDNVLIGRYWGADQLGVYSKAYQLLLLPLNQINAPIANVAIPTLSRLLDTPERYRQVYLRILEKVLLLTMPLIVFMAATADWLVQILLGSQWSEVSELFLLLAIAGLFQPVANSTGWLFISQGRTNQMFQWGIVGSSVAVISFLIGLPWGATGVATSYSVIWILVCMPLLFWFVGRKGPVKARHLYLTLMPIVLASLCSALSLGAFRRWGDCADPMMGCGLALILTGSVFFTSLWLMPQGKLAIQDIRNLWATLRSASS